jgi:protein O-GlcNAc transferase
LELALEKNWRAAEIEFKRSLDYIPGRVSTCTNLCAVLIKQNKIAESERILDCILAQSPDDPTLLAAKGLIFFIRNQLSSSVDYCERTIAICPESFDAWITKANALCELERYDDALASYDVATRLRPGSATAWNDRAGTLNKIKRHAEALENYSKAFALDPTLDFCLGELIHTKMQLSDWSSIDAYHSMLKTRISAREPSALPFVTLSLFDSAHIQKIAAETYVTTRLQSTSPFPRFANRKRAEKIRVGYFSADFHNHATMFLIAGLFEFHNKEKFDIVGFSFGQNNFDSMRQRAKNAMEKFIDVSQSSISEIVRCSRENKIDIAIDLKGYTAGSRPQIFSERVAPIQISYLGYPGTMGSPYIDYTIADRVVVPEESRSFFSEKIIYLPHCYQVNDSRRKKPINSISRTEVGLPEYAFVFGCFNNSYKVTPEMFRVWIRILEFVANSVIWLFADNCAVENNLRAEALRYRLNPERLVFAKRTTHIQHLSRYQLIDLCLDTFPYGSHTTASDALWCGVPLLTLQGNSFPSRVASSLLTTVGLPQLITNTQSEYILKAIRFATKPEELSKIREILTKNHQASPLFNTRLFAQQIEAAYQSVYNRYHAGKQPEHTYIDAQEQY